MLVSPRIHVEFAAAAAKAVILRRGPTEWVRLLSWDTSTDEIEAGAWFHGRIYDDRCSISPNGELFAYLAAKHQGNPGKDDCGSWTAISRPPWLTAIAFWPQNGTQGIATSFVDDNTLVISHPHWDELRPKNRIPDGFNVLSRLTGRGAPDQSLPSPSESKGRYSDGRGVDQFNNAFEYIDGMLMRDGSVIADLDSMKPQPQESPQWARSW